MTNSPLFGLILAGGSGSRLWPLSREMYPKQLLKLNDENTLFQSTFLRLANIIPDKNIITVANTKHSTDIKLQLADIKTEFKQKDEYRVLIEPIGRNTAPAIALSVFYVIQKMTSGGDDPILFVAPSDHIIQNEQAFIDAVTNGTKLAEAGYIVTFGIKPDKPDTGYGYISTSKVNSISDISPQGLKVQEFKEKPDQKTAEEYVNLGTYFWNSGMFMFKASTMLKELEKHCSEIFNIMQDIPLFSEGPTVKYDDYISMPDISIDYAVMEKSDLISLIPLDCGWNDMGSWQAIFDTAEKDSHKNFISGNVVDFESENSLIYGTSKLVTTIGLKDTVVVETEDAILVCDKNKTQDVKKIYNQLKKQQDNAYLVHSTVFRPWGYYTVLQKGDGFLVKLISVNPGAKLSLQMHYHRSEHWNVLSGTAKVIKDNKEFFLKPGESIDIPATMQHSLQNPGKIDLKIIEVQSGSYLEEDDIVRFEDIYGRAMATV